MNTSDIEYKLYALANTGLRIELLEAMKKLGVLLGNGVITDLDAFNFLREAVLEFCDKQGKLDDETFPVFAIDEEG